MTLKAVVFETLDNLTEPKVSGWRLFDLVYLRTGRRPYPSTILGYAREWADISGGTFECVDPQNSVYKIEVCAKIAGAIRD